MKIQDMPCPHNWINCDECENLRLCQSGLYDPDKSILEIAAEIADESVIAEAKESAEKIRGGTWFDSFIKMTPEESMNWFYSNRTQGLHHKEPIPQDGPSSPGGSKSGKIKKSKRGNKVSIEPWTAIV